MTKPMNRAPSIASVQPLEF